MAKTLAERDRHCRQTHGMVTVQPPERAGPVFGPAIHAPPPVPVA
jgi:hypothetical protein